MVLLPQFDQFSDFSSGSIARSNECWRDCVNGCAAAGYSIQYLKQHQMRKKWFWGILAVILLTVARGGDQNRILRVDGVWERACRIAPTVHSLLWPPHT